MSNPAPAACPETDRVVACFLDGAPSGTRAPLFLAEHLAGCGACTRALQDARRLDALVATTSRRPDVEHEAALLRNLRTALLAPAPDRAVVGHAPTRRRLLAGLAALVLVGATLLLARGSAPVEITPEPARSLGATAQPDAPTPREPGEDTVLLLPDPPAGARTTFATEARATTAPEFAFARTLQHASEAAFVDLLAPLAAPVLEASGRELRLRLAEALATPAGERVSARLLRHVQNGTPWCLRLVARLPDATLLRALRTRVRGDLERSELVVLAAHANPDPTLLVELALGLWVDLERRGESPSRVAIATTWFGALPVRAVPALLAELVRTPNGMQRERCLHALAAAEAPAAVSTLLTLARGPRYEEAMLAAFALSRCLPPGTRFDDLRPNWSGAIRARPQTFAEFLRLCEASRRTSIESE